MPNTLCCVSKMEPHSLKFLQKMSDWSKKSGWQFLLAIDGSDVNLEQAHDFTPNVMQVKSLGYIESVLDSVIDRCPEGYIFRLDDDEFFSPDLQKWLETSNLKSSKIYSFPRCNLWKDENHYIPGLYPDTQIRLATKKKSYGRNVIHNLSPHGFGTTIKYPIYHYKFLVKSYEERKYIAEIYEKVRQGAGFGDYLVYNIPEDYYKRKGVEVFHEPIKSF